MSFSISNSFKIKKSIPLLLLIFSLINLSFILSQENSKDIKENKKEIKELKPKENPKEKNFLDEKIKDKEIYELFLDFISFQGKSYKSIEDFNEHFSAFKENLKRKNFSENENFNLAKIDAHNLPKFIDISKEQFRKKYLNLKIKLDPEEQKKKEEKSQKEKEKKRNLQTSKTFKNIRNLSDELPKNFDWRKFGVVSSVKEQGECGVCWAFAAAGNLESLYAIKYKKILDLSEEQMLDCDLVNDGCDGGNMEDAFRYIRQAGGLMNEVDYPYTQKKDKCLFNKKKSVIKVRGWKILDTSDEDEIARILMRKGPLSIGINGDELQLHDKGIYDPSQRDCPKDDLNHAVLIVGFGEEDDGRKFWIMKNSWGENWADEGFFKIARGKSTCGINQYVVYGKLG